MKLNPFSKKSNPYLDKVKAEQDALNLELAPLKAELAEAEAEHAAAREKQTRLRDAAGSMSMNTPPAAKAHWPILCEANQRMERLKSKVSNLESQLRPLQQVLATPERFALSRKQLDDLIAQRKALTAEAQTVDGQLTKIAKRLADLEARIATETKSASRMLLDTEAEFVMPETKDDSKSNTIGNIISKNHHNRSHERINSNSEIRPFNLFKACCHHNTSLDRKSVV